MFCTSLRRRKEWASIPSILLSQQQPKWQELALETHDLAIPLPQSRQQDQKEFFRFLFLSPADIRLSEKLLARIERLYQSGGKHVGIVFLLHEKDSQENSGTRGFMNLQVSLISSNLEMPIIPLPTLSSLTQIISAFHRQLCQSYAHLPLPLEPNMALLPYCTNNPPISEHARNVLSDLCHSVRDLAQTATTTRGKKVLREWLTEPSTAVVEDVIGFWEEEYIAE